MRLASTLLPRLVGMGLALAFTSMTLLSLGAQADRQHQELLLASLQHSAQVAQSCTPQSAQSPRS